MAEFGINPNYSEEVICYPDKELDNGWIIKNCGCCGGLRWGGNEPIECYDCKGSGYYYKHKKSGVLAQYPGGPFMGREKPINDEWDE